MQKISDIISLPVINLYETKIEGYIEKVYINPTKQSVCSILIYDEIHDTYKIANYENLYKMSEDCVFISNSSKLTLFENAELSLLNCVFPINSIAYEMNGEKLGVVKDICIEKNKIISLTIDDTDYPSCLICGMSEDITLISRERKVSLSKFKQPKKKIIKVSTLTSDEPVVSILETPVIPIKEITNYNFLLNRTLLKDIKNSSGEIIAHANSKINLSMLQKLKYYGRLKELTLNSK